MFTPRPPQTRNRPRWVGICALLVLVLAASMGCSTTSESPEVSSPHHSLATDSAADDQAAVSLAAHPVTTSSEVANVFGRLPKARRKAVRRKVESVVDAWWEAAYLGGDYPRRSFDKPFPGFTKGAEARARRDKALMTSRDISEDIDSVVAQQRRVQLDVLAVGRRPRSVTARFKLRFDAMSGETSKRVVVRGRLFLTQRKGTWRIFGYDVAKASGKGGKA